METTTKKRRGFAAMSPEKQREIASKGGTTAHATGRARKFDSESGKAAWLKGPGRKLAPATS